MFLWGGVCRICRGITIFPSFRRSARSFVEMGMLFPYAPCSYVSLIERKIAEQVCNDVGGVFWGVMVFFATGRCWTMSITDLRSSPCKLRTNAVRPYGNSWELTFLKLTPALRRDELRSSEAPTKPSSKPRQQKQPPQAP